MNLSASTNFLTPSGKEEPWRFTPMTRLGGLHDESTKVISSVSLEFNQKISGVTFQKIAAKELPASYVSTDEITARIRNSVSEIAVLKVEKNVELAQPLILKRKTSGAPELSRTVISLEQNARASVIIENSGAAVLGEEIEINLAPGSALNFITLQEWNKDAIHLAQHHAVLGRDSQFNSYTISIGGSLVRILPTVEYSGPGASAELFGLYFATNGQHLEHRIHVDHNVANAKSRVNYKGALAGEKARTVWFGDVYIRKIAEGTDTYELNRNLLLTDGARADSVPNLEIETGEIVGAGHASTTGRFDDEQLFYLCSRGISPDVARRLVIRGFFNEIVSKLSNEEIEERLMNRIDLELGMVGK